MPMTLFLVVASAGALVRGLANDDWWLVALAFGLLGGAVYRERKRP